jgi:hypothetical protein
MIETKITGSCVECSKIYHLNHLAPNKPSDNQIKLLQTSEKCPDCNNIQIRSILNFHWTGTEEKSFRYQSARSFTYDYLKSPSIDITDRKKKNRNRVYFIDSYSFNDSQLANVLRKIKSDMGLTVRDCCDAVAIALYESLNEGTLWIITNRKNNWIHMVLQLDKFYFDLEGKHDKDDLIRQWVKKEGRNNYFIKEISYEKAYDLMDWRVEEEKNWLKDELYERIKEIKPSYEQIPLT